MEPPREALQESIAQQREALIAILQQPLRQVAAECCRVWGDRAGLDAVLSDALKNLPHGKFLYALDSDAHQISDNISRDGLIEKDFGRDRANRPYMRGVTPGADFFLSESYISLAAKRPSLTAVQTVRDATGAVLGFVGADFDLRDLPMTRELYEEPRYWRQLKGDPSIRGTVFHQTRADSEMDGHVDTVLSIVEALMVDHGVYHVMLHFSSSRAVIWVMQDPYRYRLLDIDRLIDPDSCLAYPRTPYPADALVPATRIREALDRFRALRLMDDMFYLRSATLNIFNGIVGLTFSCDGSHYIPYDEFLGMDQEFWLGSSA